MTENLNLLMLTVTANVMDSADAHDEVDVSSVFAGADSDLAHDLDPNAKDLRYVSGLLARLACRIAEDMPLCAIAHGCDRKQRATFEDDTCHVYPYGHTAFLPIGVAVRVPKTDRVLWQNKIQRWLDELLALEARLDRGD